ncbi:hypothetical protein MTO96_024223 [Rhipicephalus appendiculatus]
MPGILASPYTPPRCEGDADVMAAALRAHVYAAGGSRIARQEACDPRRARSYVRYSLGRETKCSRHTRTDGKNAEFPSACCSSSSAYGELLSEGPASPALFRRRRF